MYFVVPYLRVNCLLKIRLDQVTIFFRRYHAIYDIRDDILLMKVRNKRDFGNNPKDSFNSIIKILTNRVN